MGDKRTNGRKGEGGKEKNGGGGNSQYNNLTPGQSLNLKRIMSMKAT